MHYATTTLARVAMNSISANEIISVTRFHVRFVNILRDSIRVIIIISRNIMKNCITVLSLVISSVSQSAVISANRFYDM